MEHGLLPWWLGPALCAVALIAVAFWGWRSVSEVSRWKLLRGGGPVGVLHIRFWVEARTGKTPPEPFVEEKLVRCFNLAYSLLSEHGPWSAAQLWSALSEIYIAVMLGEPWHQGAAYGRPDENRIRTLYVGHSLRGLAHEMAHLIEKRIEGRVDAEHTTWRERQIDRAVSRYTSTLTTLYG